MYEILKGKTDIVVFIKGDTKKVSDCSQEELELLAKNSPGVYVKKTENNQGGEVIVNAPAAPVVEDQPAPSNEVAVTEAQEATEVNIEEVNASELTAEESNTSAATVTDEANTKSVRRVTKK